MNDMIVEWTWTRTIIIIAVTTSVSGNMLDFTTSTESSAEYLRNVMLELRDMSAPPSPAPDRSTGPLYFDVDDRHFLAGKRYSKEKKIIQQIVEQLDNSGSQTSVLHGTAKKLTPVALDQAFAESATHNQYYQVPAIAPPPQKAIASEVPGFTKAELAAAYNHALEKGSAVSLNALANVLRHKQMPVVTTNQVELAPAQPMYTYYFYPLKSFMNDMRHNVQTNVLPLVPDFRPENTEVTQGTQKEVANPLFMAVSGFIGMAVLFMIGILLVPRLNDFIDFSSRVSNEEEYLRLTKTIGEAIDRQNCTEYPDIKDLDKRAAIRKPVKMARPSSVVLLTSNSKRQKDATRRRKIPRNCKNAPCKKSRRVALT